MAEQTLPTIGEIKYLFLFKKRPKKYPNFYYLQAGMKDNKLVTGTSSCNKN